MHRFNKIKVSIFLFLFGLIAIPLIQNLIKPNYNVILIVIDTLRADHMGLYGYHRNTTPNIDKFAENAIVFENAATQASWTLPSFTSMLTSRYPRSVFFLPEYVNLSLIPLNEHNFFRVALNSVITLPEIFNAQGYKTAGFVAIVPLSSTIGFSKAFDFYDEEGAINERKYFKELGTIKELNKRIFKWLEENKGGNFFMMVDYGDVHCPYDPPEEFKIFSKRKLDFSAIRCINLEKYLPNGTISKEDIADAYDEGIFYTDHFLGEFFEKTKELNLDRNTIVVITADHGEELAHHFDFISHTESAYQSVVHIPLIIKHPEFEWKVIISPRVGLIDLTPTILDFLKVPIPSNFEGKSLLPLIKGNEKSNRTIIFTAGPRWDLRYRGFAIIDIDNYKFITYLDGKKDELYDLNLDPNESKNLISENSKKAKELKENLILRIMDFVEKSKKVAEKAKGKLSEIGQIDEEEQKDLLESLRQLGYVT